MSKGKNIGGIQIGTSFLVLIFVVLALVIFSVLSLLSALSDNKLTEKSIDSVAAYYEADAAAEEKLALINEELGKLSAIEGQFTEQMAESLDVSYDQETAVISYSMKINENLTLFVDLKAQRDAAVTGKNYEILRWQEMNTADYEIDDSLQLWTGEE